MPSWSRAADSTALLSGSMVRTTSASATASAIVAAPPPPALARAAMAASLWSWPVTTYPARTRCAAIGAPMMPRPMKAMVLSVMRGPFGAGGSGWLLPGAEWSRSGAGAGGECGGAGDAPYRKAVDAPTVDGYVRSGDVAGLVGEQEECCYSDLLGLADAPERDGLFVLGPLGGRVGRDCEFGREQRGVDGARTYGVDTYPAAGHLGCK